MKRERTVVIWRGGFFFLGGEGGGDRVDTAVRSLASMG